MITDALFGKSNRLLLLCKSADHNRPFYNIVISMGKRKDMIHPRFLSEYRPDHGPPVH